MKDSLLLQTAGSPGLLRCWALNLLQQNPTGRENIRGKHQIMSENPNWLPEALNSVSLQPQSVMRNHDGKPASLRLMPLP